MIEKSPRDKMIEKVRLLFAVADPAHNCHEGEMKTALDMANKIMKEHNLTMSEIELREKGNVVQSNIEYGKEMHDWQYDLAVVLSRLFNVEIYLLKTSKEGPITSLCYIGFRDDVKVATDALMYLTIEIMKNASNEDDRIFGFDKLSYCIGVVVGLNERVEEILMQNKTQTEENIKYGSLIVVKESEIKKWMEEQGVKPKTKRGRKNRRERDENNIDPYSFHFGREDAQDLDLNNHKKLGENR